MCHIYHSAIYPALADGKSSLYHGKVLLFWTTFTNVSNGVYTCVTEDIFDIYYSIIINDF